MNQITMMINLNLAGRMRRQSIAKIKAKIIMMSKMEKIMKIKIAPKVLILNKMKRKWKNKRHQNRNLNTAP
jgi:hypothetical protein